MSRPGAVMRFSISQLYEEDRKQRAHLRKINDMKRTSQVDHHSPPRFPHLHKAFVRQLEDRQQAISKENQFKSKRIIGIMTSKHEPLSQPTQPKIPVRRNQTLHSTHNDAQYKERLAKVKGKYDTQEWKQAYKTHKEYLRLSKDKHVFTPLDLGKNRERLKTLSLNASKRTTPSSSRFNLFYPSRTPEEF